MATLPLRGTSLGNPDDAAARAIARGGKNPEHIRRYARSLWAACAELSVRADVAFAQADVETGDRSTGVGFRSDRWVQEGNPAGISIVTGMPDGTPGPVRTPEEWGIIHATHLGGYAGVDPPDEWKEMDIRWDAMIRAGYLGVAETVDDLDQRWAWDPRGPQDYGGKIEARWRLYDFPAMTTTPDPQPGNNGGNDMATYKTAIPGLPGGPLETSFPIKLMIVPAWRTNNRPGIKARTPRLSVQHETANSGTYAAAEANYLYNGAGGRQASWHFTVDDREGYVTIPVDEVAWQAGDGSGPGNYNGVACELAVHRDIVNNPTRRAQSQKNAAELMGKVGARLNATPPARQHANFMLKDCPHWLRTLGEWNRYVDWWHHFYQMEKAAMDGKPAPEQPVFYIGDTIKALVPLNLRQRAGTGNVPVIATLPVGTQAVINGPFEWKDGYGWLPVETSYGNGFVAMGENGVLWIEKVKDRPAPQPEPEPEPEPEPQYVPARPIPALLETDLKKYDTAEGITTDDLGQDFIFVADVIEFTKDTVAAQFAVKNPKPVKAPYHAGDRAIAAWLVKSQDTDSWWYVLAGGDDEWVRVRYDHTKRVSDAPLLGDEWGESEEADVSDVINALKDVLDDSAN